MFLKEMPNQSHTPTPPELGHKVRLEGFGSEGLGIKTWAVAIPTR